MSDLGYAQNYTNILEVNITPNEATETWAWVGPGINNITNDASEETSEDEFYDSEGNTETEVTKLTRGFSPEGYRRFTDDFQNFVASIADLTGEDRRTQYRITSPNGQVKQANCTIKDIKVDAPDGAPSDRMPFSCSIAQNGAFTDVTPAAGTSLPESVTATIAALTVKKSVTVTPTVTPSTASQRCLFSVSDDSIATITNDGVLTGVAAGKVKVRIKCAAKPSVYTTVEVDVKTS
jgi:uncharacterized protein YjdB